MNLGDIKPNIIYVGFFTTDGAMVEGTNAPCTGNPTTFMEQMTKLTAHIVLYAEVVAYQRM